MACFLTTRKVGYHGTKQGAGLYLPAGHAERIQYALGKSEEAYLRALASSFMLSADNATRSIPTTREQHGLIGNCAYINW